jgi:hypothetical protein
VEPRVRIEITQCRAERTTGHWLVTWRVCNDGPDPLGLQAAWIPHGRFRGEGRLPLSVQVAAGESSDLDFTVAASEPPGTLVKNAFLILRVTNAGQSWRIFTRMRIEFDVDAVPRPIVEVVTEQFIQ